MKILAIDDNPDNLTALKAVMADRLPKATLLTALNGPHGLALAEAEDPDVILLDIVMPGLDGYAVCRKLKEDAYLQTIPVLFLTALKTDRNSRIKALDAGAEGFLTKPFDEIELAVQIQAMAKIKAATLMQRDDNTRLAGLVAERTRLLQQSGTQTKRGKLSDAVPKDAERLCATRNHLCTGWPTGRLPVSGRQPGLRADDWPESRGHRGPDGSGGIARYRAALDRDIRQGGAHG
jgi:DNA-binding response OmpR family regulator